MGLFDKKNCDICGGKIGLLGNRKLDDGNMCKDCAKKLSEWFDGRRNATQAQIKEQLAYREQNLANLKGFDPTITLGDKHLVCIDEAQKKFIVKQTKDIFSENPDLLDLSQVTGCDVKVNEQRVEQKQVVNGQSTSYNPPRYRTTYTFEMSIRVKHPYFDTMNFELNDDPVMVDHRGTTSGGLFGGRTTTTISAPISAEYQRYEQMGQEIKQALMSAKSSTANAPTAPTANVPVECPSCGAKITPNASGKCEFCGNAVN